MVMEGVSVMLEECMVNIIFKVSIYYNKLLFKNEFDFFRKYGLLFFLLKIK